MKTNDKYKYPYIPIHPWACTTHRRCHRKQEAHRKGTLEVELRCKRLQVLGTPAHGEEDVRKDKSSLKHNSEIWGRNFLLLMKRRRTTREKGRQRTMKMKTWTAKGATRVQLREEDAVTRVPHLPLDSETGAAPTAVPARVNQPHKAGGSRW